MIRAVIVDDENGAREVLRGVITDHFPRIEITGEAGTVSEAISLINNEEPGLLFLDVELGNETAFDLLSKINVEEMDLIFTTAHEHYALQAIRFSALDYLLKPVTKEDLNQALDRMEKRTLKVKLREVLDLMKYNLDNPAPALKKILLPVDDHLEAISLQNIILCSSDSNYTSFFLADKRKIVATQTLKEYEALLSPFGFCRVHHASLINMSHVKGYIKGEGGYAIMDDDSKIEVSRRKKDDFLKLLMAS